LRKEKDAKLLFDEKISPQLCNKSKNTNTPETKSKKCTLNNNEENQVTSEQFNTTQANIDKMFSLQVPVWSIRIKSNVALQGA